VAANPTWESFSIQLPGQELLEKARNVLETLVVFLEVLKTILETVKAFLVDFGNPIRALVEALIQLILALFTALQRTGVYAWFDIPKPFSDPDLLNHLGGYEAFTTRFKGGLFDSRDPNRPQPVPGFTKSGFTLVVADAESIEGLYALIEVLLKFFGKEFTTPEYAAPANFKVLPLGDSGDPILSVVKLFQDQPKSVVVEWALPPTTNPGEPGFSDLIQAFSTHFFPPRFLIEKSEINPAVGEIDIAELANPDSAGIVTAILPTVFELKPNQPISRKARIPDSYQNPFVKFQKYIVLDTSNNTSSFILGQLGTFRYIDTDVEPGKLYYYRVRAYSGDLKINGSTVLFDTKTKTNPDSNLTYIEWPGVIANKPPVMGRGTGIVPVRIPIFPPDFNVFESLRRVFQTAFSLNFHQPISSIVPLPDADIGKGSLTSLAGPLTSFNALPLVGPSVSGALGVTETFQPNEATGLLPVLPWNTYGVQTNSSRLAITVAGAMLEGNVAESYKTIMEGAYPNGAPPSSTGLKATNLEEMVFEITKVQDDEDQQQKAVQAAGVLYGGVYGDEIVRQNMLSIINFLKAFTLGGEPPDWIQVSLLRDIVPWAGQLLYELLAKIQALLDAYSGIIDEIKDFIDLIIRKINILEQFLQYLIQLLDFILSLAVSFHLLAVPETSGGTIEWVSLIDNAGGIPPPSGPGGYTAGVALAYVALDVTLFKEAFNLIF
jgi:hypothetical protein